MAAPAIRSGGRVRSARPGGAEKHSGPAVSESSLAKLNFLMDSHTHGNSPALSYTDLSQPTELTVLQGLCSLSSRIGSDAPVILYT